jgi:vitamin B12 transporter
MTNVNPIYRQALLASATFLCLTTFPGFNIALADDAVELDPIRVVTASKTDEDPDRAMASVSVISASDIQHSAAQDILELLRMQAGVDIVRTGGAGGQTSVFMRGGNSNHTLVLIDGMRVASAHSGAYAWEHLPLNQIERIEIVRGPRATLFGSDAIGGVIQIFTRQVENSHVKITSGSFSTNEFEAGTGFNLGPASISINAAYRDSDGFSSQNMNGFSYHPDEDGFESRNLGINARGETSNGSWQLHIMGLENEVEFDEGVSDSEQLYLSLGLEGEFGNNWSYNFQAGFLDDELNSDFIFFTSGFESSRTEFSWDNRLLLDRGALTFGLDHYNESGTSQFSYDQDRHNSAAFAMWEQEWNGKRVQLSTRWDDNSLFGSEWTYQAALGFAVGSKGELLGLLGTAFRAPTMSEQYSPGFGGLFAGNPNLQPESSESVEFIYRLELSERSRIALSAYQTDVDQLIAFTGQDFQAVNVNRAELRGIELEYKRSLDSWQFDANATVQNTEDVSTGTSLLRRPDQKASVAVSRFFDNGSWLAGEWFVSGDRMDFGGIRLPGYNLINLSAGYRFTPAYSLELRLDNLLDQNYEPASGFNSADRSAFVSLNWSP